MRRQFLQLLMIGGRPAPAPYGIGSLRRELSQLLITVGWWPADVDFDFSDLATVQVLLEQRRKQGR